MKRGAVQQWFTLRMLIVLLLIVLGVFLLMMWPQARIAIGDEINKILVRLGLQEDELPAPYATWDNDQVRQFLDAQKPANLEEGSYVRFQICKGFDECDLEVKFQKGEWKFRRISYAIGCDNVPRLGAQKANKCYWWKAQLDSAGSAMVEAGGELVKNALDQEDKDALMDLAKNSDDFGLGLRSLLSFVEGSSEFKRVVLLRDDELILPPISERNVKSDFWKTLKQAEKDKLSRKEIPVAVDFQVNLFGSGAQDTILEIVRSFNKLGFLAVKADEQSKQRGSSTLQQHADERIIYTPPTGSREYGLIFKALDSERTCNSQTDPHALDMIETLSSSLFLFVGDDLGQFLDWGLAEFQQVYAPNTVEYFTIYDRTSEDFVWKFRYFQKFREIWVVTDANLQPGFADSPIKSEDWTYLKGIQAVKKFLQDNSEYFLMEGSEAKGDKTKAEGLDFFDNEIERLTKDFKTCERYPKYTDPFEHYFVVGDISEIKEVARSFFAVGDFSGFREVRDGSDVAYIFGSAPKADSSQVSSGKIVILSD